jgi:hypothetical protein
MSGGEVVEQVIRPTGLVDPVVRVEPAKGQVAALMEEALEEDLSAPHPLSSVDAATFLMDAPHTTAYLSTPTTPGDTKNQPLDTISTARSTRLGDDMKNPDPAKSDVVPTDPPPPPPKKSRLTRPVIIGLACFGLAIGAALVRLLVR